MKKFLASVLTVAMLLSTLVTSTVLTSSAETVQGQVVAHSKWGFESGSSKTHGTKTPHESLGRTTYAVTAFEKGAAKLE